MRWSRDRGRKGHRILRRVLVDGRHLRLSRAIAFHEAVVTATLAASSHGKKRKGSQEPKARGTRRRSHIPRKRERRQRCQRLDRNGRRGNTTPTLAIHASKKRCAETRQGSACPAAIRRSVHECRETLGPPVKPHGAKDSVGCPRGDSRGVKRDRARYGYTHHHSGGRSRSDASRALSASRSQALVEEKQGASQKEARKHRLTRGTGRETAKRCAEKRSRLKVRAGSACGFRLAGSRYDGRCSRAFARPTLTGSSTRGPSARRSI
jgi:hypothetical protein